MQITKISPEEAERAALKLLEKTCPLMVGTIGKDGGPNVRYLVVGAFDGLETVWFSTSAGSEKVAEIKADPRAVLYGSHPETMSEFRLFGTVELLTDMESRKRVWKEEYKQYWPDGIESPDIMVLKFSTRRGCYNGSDGKSGTFEL